MKNYQKAGLATVPPALLGAAGYGVYKLATMSSETAEGSEVAVIEVPAPEVTTNGTELTENLSTTNSETAADTDTKNESSEVPSQKTPPAASPTKSTAPVKTFAQSDTYKEYERKDWSLGHVWKEDLLSFENKSLWTENERYLKNAILFNPVSQKFKVLKWELLWKGTGSLMDTCKSSLNISNNGNSLERTDVWRFCTTHKGFKLTNKNHS